MDFTRHRGTHRLAPTELQARVFELLRTETVNDRRSDRELRITMAELLNRGIGLDVEGGAGEGYRQILALYGATLLKLAGAGVDAIDAEVRSRDESRLELLVRAVLSRLAQATEAGDPGRNEGASSSHAGSAVAESQPVPVASFANLASPFYRRAERTSSAALRAVESPAFAYVRERLTPEVLRYVRTFPDDLHSPDHDPEASSGFRHTPRPESRPAMALAVGRAPTPPATAQRLDLGDGAVVELDAEAAERCRTANGRAALIRALASALQRELGEAK